MKIAVVIPKYGLVGGAEGFVYELTERLAVRKGLEIHVFANKWKRGKAPITFHKVPILVFPRFMRQISFSYFVDKRISSKDYDLVHSHDRIFHADLLTMHGIPHKTWIKETRQKRMSLFDRAMARVEEKVLTGPNMPMVLPVSSLVKNELLRLYDIPESKLRVIHPGVSPDRFSALDRKTCRNEIRARHGLSGRDVVVLFVGMNFEIKRLDLVLRGVAHLVTKDNRNQTLKVLVVGKGEWRRYMALARDLGIGDRVIFTGVTREVEKYYLAGDIFAMPSMYDTFGMAVLEAMMAGLPVIITGKVGAKDLVDSGVHGFVLGEDPSPPDLSEKLAFLMDEKNRMKMGENARQTALQHTWDKVADQVADLYPLLARGGTE